MGYDANDDDMINFMFSGIVQFLVFKWTLLMFFLSF